MVKRFVLVSTIFLLLFTSCEGNPSSDSNEITITPSNLLVAETSHKSSGTSSVDIWFSPPEDLGATSYTLQTSLDDETWNDFTYNYEILVTDTASQDNFSVNLGADCYVRLKITGGTYDGQYSNSMFAPHAIDAYYFNNTTLDESPGNTGVMMPNAGYGLWASFTVRAVTDNSLLEDGLSYQWCRVKADDFDQTTLITGDTGLEYTTTEADKGHFIMIEALGKPGIIDGGMRRLFSTEVVR